MKKSLYLCTRNHEKWLAAKNFEMMRQQDKQGANKAPRQAYGRDNEPRPQGQRKRKKLNI